MLNNMGLGVACSVWGFLRLAGFGVASAGGVRACGCVCCWGWGCVFGGCGLQFLLVWWLVLAGLCFCMRLKSRRALLMGLFGGGCY